MIRFIAVCFLATSISANTTNTIDDTPEAFVLTEKQQRILESGKPVFPPVKEVDGKGGAATAIFRVKAPPATVWKVIKDFDQYKNWVDGVKDTVRYEGKDKNKTYIKFQVGKWFTPTYTYHIVHNYVSKDKGFGTWILDSDKPNDLTECVGHWRVTPLKDDPEQSTVEYSVNLQAEGFVLKIIRPILIKNGVKDATSWVKKQAELLASSGPK